MQKLLKYCFRPSYINQQALTKDREDQGQTIENRSKMNMRSQETNKIFLAFFHIKIQLELK